MWDALAPIGRDPRTGGYRRYAWTREDATLREWFAGEAAARGLDLAAGPRRQPVGVVGRPGRRRPGLVLGSHLDSVPDGGAFDGPLGRRRPPSPRSTRCATAGRSPPAGRRGATSATRRARASASPAPGRASSPARWPPTAPARLTDADGVHAGRGGIARPARRPTTSAATTRRCAASAPSSSCTSSRDAALVDLDRPVAVGTAIRPHGRWRIDLPGRADHAGTTAARRPATTRCSRWPRLVLAVRAGGRDHGGVATCGKVEVAPNGVNAIAVARHRLAGRPRRDRGAGAAVVADVGARVPTPRRRPSPRSPGPASPPSTDRSRGGWPPCSTAPRCSTPAPATTPACSPPPGIPTAMLFVRNPTGVSHSPAEHAERDDCLAGVEALTARRGASWCGDGAGSPRHALLPGGLARDVRFEVADGRFTAVTPGSEPGGADRLPGVVAARASPTCTATPSTGRCAGARTPAAARSGRGASGCTPSPRPSTRTPTSPSPAPRTPRWCSPGSPRWGSSTTCTTRPAAGPTPTRTRWATRCRGRAGEAGLRLTLLDTCYLAGGLDADGYRPLDDVQRRFADRDVDAWAATGRGARLTTPRPGRRRRPLGPGRPARRPAHRRRRGRRRPAARPPVRAAGRERGLPGRARPHADAAARRTPARSGRPPPLSTRTHLTHADIATLGGHAVSPLLLPDHGA